MIGEEVGFIDVPADEGSVSGTMSDKRESRESVSAGPLNGDYASIWHGGFEGEPSLFEEMGIHNTDVMNNLKVILAPMSEVQTVDDNFLVGMLFFCLFGGALLLLGKVRFGMVYLIGVTGFLILYFLFKFMSPHTLSMGHLFTALSYCTIPLAPFVLIAGVLRLGAKLKTVFAVPFIAWSAYSATRYVMTQLVIRDITALVFVPLFIFYAFLLLLPIY